MLNVGQPQINEDGGGDKDNHSNQRCPNGAGGARNTDTSIQAEPTPGGKNGCPVPEIIINEVDADQTSTDSAEFVELYDGGTGGTDLTGLVRPQLAFSHAEWSDEDDLRRIRDCLPFNDGHMAMSIQELKAGEAK